MSYATVDGQNNPVTLKSTTDGSDEVIHNIVDNVVAQALPTGAATEATLSAADTKLGTANTTLTAVANRLSGESQLTAKITFNAAANSSDPAVLAAPTAGKRVVVEGFSVRSLDGGGTPATLPASDLLLVELQEDSTGDLIAATEIVGFGSKHVSLASPFTVGADDRGVDANFVVRDGSDYTDNSGVILNLEITMFYREI